MELTQDQGDNERLVVIYNDSHLFSRTDILEVLKANTGRDDPYYPFKQLLETMNVKADQQSRVLPCDTQARGQGWDLDAIERVIDDLKRQPRTGVIKVFISVQSAEEAKRSLQDEQDLNNRNILTEEYSPRTVFELTSGQFGATHPQIPAGIPTIVTDYAASYEPPIPVRQAATEPAILAHCSVAPAEPNALSLYTLNPTLRSMMFDEPQETYYEQDPRFDELGNK